MQRGKVEEKKSKKREISDGCVIHDFSLIQLKKITKCLEYKDMQQSSLPFSLTVGCLLLA